MKYQHPVSGLLATLLEFTERGMDNRLNGHLSKVDIGETIRVAIDCLESEASSGMVHISSELANNFAYAVQELFRGDSEWSLYDLGHAAEFCKAIGFTPHSDALSVGD